MPVEVSIHPPFTDIRSVQTVIDADKLDFALGAQHCHWEDKGAFTGEVSPVFLAKLGVQYVICGHSERRELFGETDEMVGQEGGRHPAARHDADHVRRRDARRARGGRDREQGARPGRRRRSTGRSAEQVGVDGDRLRADLGDRHRSHGHRRRRAAVCAAIRARGRRAVGADAAATVRIQYGGSVKAGTIAELMAEPDVDGALVGGASLDPDEFARIAKLGRLSPPVRRDRTVWNNCTDFFVR